jgi:hypothetical protein
MLHALTQYTMSAQASSKRRRGHSSKTKMSTAQLYAQIALVIVIIGGIAAFAYFAT